MTNELNIGESIDVILRNWIPQRKWDLKSQALNRTQAMFSESSQKLQIRAKDPISQVQKDSQDLEKQMGLEQLRKSTEHSQDSRQPTTANKTHFSQNSKVSATMKSK